MSIDTPTGEPMSELDRITFREKANGDVAAYIGDRELQVICWAHQTGNNRLQAIAQNAFQLGVQDQQQKARSMLSSIMGL